MGIISCCLFFSPSMPLALAAEVSSPQPSPVQQQASPSVAQPEPASEQEQKIQTISPEKNTLEPDTRYPQEEVPTQLTEKQRQCEERAQRLHGFFAHLDQREYIQDFQLGVPSQQYFLNLATKLLNNPPIVSRESDDLYTILKNMAHFFRVIGGKNIVIIKGILDRERDTIEDVASDLFLWTTGEECSSEAFVFEAPSDRMYEYAGFFLNSMGGRSYLFRRDSRSRLLVNYYAMLLIDRANREGANRHGIDIKPLLPTTINEIESSNQLIYKEKYLDDLYELLEKYL